VQNYLNEKNKTHALKEKEASTWRDAWARHEENIQLIEELNN